MLLRVLFALAFAVVLTLASVFLVGTVMALLTRTWPGAGQGLLPAAAVEVLVYCAFIAWLARDFESPRARFGLGATSLELLVIGALLGVALHGPADFVEACVERWLPLPDGVLLERASRLSPTTFGERVWLLLAVACVIPIVEELFFRGALLAWIARAATVRVAAWASAVCFTVSHLEPRSWPALGVVAAALGLLRAVSGSLWPCILLHATFNATTLAVIYSQPRESLGRSEPSFLLLGLGGAISALLLLRVRRAEPKLSENPG